MLVAACGSAPEPRPEPLLRGDRMNEFGFDAFAQGRYLDAAHHFREAELQYLSIDNSGGAARAAISQVEAFLLLNRYGDAADIVGRAESSLARVNEPELDRRVTLLRARLAHATGQVETARGLLRTLQDPEGLLARHAALLDCQIELDAGNPDCAEHLEVDDDGSLLQARIERLRAEASMMKNDAANAERHLEHALEIYGRNHFRPGLAASHELRGRLLARQGDRDAARGELQRALFLRAWIHDQAGFMTTLELLGRLADTDEDRQRYREWRALAADDPASSDWRTLRDMIFTQR